MEKCECPPAASAGSCELAATVSVVPCPVCLQAGKSVNALTLKALLAVPLTEVRDVDYRFCRTLNCPVVYYSTDQQQRFLEHAVRERVFQKHPSDEDIFVCYCFRYTLRSIRHETVTPGQGTVVAAITAGIQAGQCACDIRNPQVSCCLGNVRAVIASLPQAQVLREPEIAQADGGAQS